jgi:hypothetical protein
VITGSATVDVARPADAVWQAVTDVTRMGEWSPECVAGRWTNGATGPTVGATFDGDNEARFAGRVVKRWTTTSTVTRCEPGRLFEFVAENYTTWRYELQPHAAGTRVVESFEYAGGGLQGFVYNVLLQRRSAMTKGMRRTLARIKDVLESA